MPDRCPKLEESKHSAKIFRLIASGQRRSILSSMEASTSRNSEFCLRSSWDIFGKVGHLHAHWRPFGVTCLLLPIERAWQKVAGADSTVTA